MADPFVAEIRIFPFNFAPKGWAFCDGQVLPLNQNKALFSVIGKIYGGNGTSNFALPDLQDRVPIHPSLGTGLSPHVLGETGGVETVQLLESEIPSHSHALSISQSDSTDPSPVGGLFAAGVGIADYASVDTNSPIVPLASAGITSTGDNQSHNNLQPYLALSFCIALQGVFPPRT